MTIRTAALRHATAATLVTFAAAGMLSCDNGGLGGFLISDQEEVAIGATVDADLEAQYPIVDEPDPLTVWARELVAPLVTASARFRDPARIDGYKVEVIYDDTLVNAFAAPGGFVYISTGLILEAENCGEIVGVLGHELAHVTQRHGVKEMGKQLVTAGIIDIFIGNEVAKQVSALAYDLAVNKPSSRADEAESDEVGTQIAHDAGYNPYGLVVFFNRIKALEEANGTPTIQFLSSHPATDDRIKDTTALIAKLYGDTVDPDDPAGYKCMGTSLDLAAIQARIRAGQVSVRAGTGQGAPVQ
ncbi:MAG: M48 family metalloprotease [Myxococcota bacterium]